MQKAGNSRASRGLAKCPQMAARELSCLPFLGSGREQAEQRKGPSLTERLRTLAVTPGPLAARPAGLTPGQQMPHITLHTVQVTVVTAHVQQYSWQQHPRLKQLRSAVGAFQHVRPPFSGCPRLTQRRTEQWIYSVTNLGGL